MQVPGIDPFFYCKKPQIGNYSCSFDLDHLHFRSALFAPQPYRSSSPQEQQSVGFDRDFRLFSHTVAITPWHKGIRPSPLNATQLANAVWRTGSKEIVGPASA
jgi:hypothetical protein